jgi:probable rRNA maturation factor
MPAERILFFIDGIQYSLRDRTKVREWLQRIARHHKLKIESLTYIFVSDERLLAINKQFLNHNTLTDIITFPADSPRGSISGEIYISIDRVRENSKNFKQSFKDELSRVMAHGLLHLCGFKDKSAKEQSAMRSQEEKALDLRTF